ncbi:MAG: hypothetical protein EOO77_03720 [Oxalobacteraceae bacterium]|nr:MAG: hypothetical protein EOO77_03720 [Oxalobacteraceae bacterium]
MDYLQHGGDAAGVAATLAATKAVWLPGIEIVEERRRSHDAGFRVQAGRAIGRLFKPNAMAMELGYGSTTAIV